MGVEAPSTFWETTSPTWLCWSCLGHAYMCSSPMTAAEILAMPVINDCKLQQEEFIGHVWVVLNTLFTVLLKKNVQNHNKIIKTKHL